MATTWSNTTQLLTTVPHVDLMGRKFSPEAIWMRSANVTPLRTTRPDFTSLLPDDGSPPLCHYNIGAQMADIEYDQAGATGGGGVQRITLSDFPRQV